MQNADFHRRIRMFRQLEYEVAWAAYDRQRPGTSLPPDIAGLSHCVLGKTFDGNHFQRVFALIAGAYRLRRWRVANRFKPQIIYARNLDNLALTAVIHFSNRLPCKILYEVADIQPAFLGNGRGRVLRALEKFALRHTDMLITTSPAFLREYFVPRLRFSGKSLVLENKVYLQPEKATPKWCPNRSVNTITCRPIRVGIFGAFRCERSIQLIAALALKFSGKLRFVFRGYPNHLVKEKFDQLLRNEEIEYHGSYKNPEDLQAMYDEVDLVWAFDFSASEGNSKWLLTNRNYEAGLFAVPQLALNGTETGRFITSNNLGWVLDEPADCSLNDFFDSISVTAVNNMSDSIATQDRYRFRADSDFENLNAFFQDLLNGADDDGAASAVRRK